MPLTSVTEAVAGTIPVIVTAGIAHRAARGLGGTRRRRVARKAKPVKRRVVKRTVKRTTKKRAAKRVVRRRRK